MLTYNVVAAGIVGVVLVLLTVPLARRAARTDGDPVLARIILIGLILKFVAAVARYWVAQELYDGSADAGVYLRFGEEYSESMRQGNFTYDGSARGGSDGTHFIRQLTGWVMFITGPSRFAAFFVFSWFSFLGAYLFHRAFALAVPGGDKRRYAYMLFFLPSLIYWPSSVGKEAWMLMTLGLSAYGIARLLTHAPGGYTIAGLGLVGSAAVRPHMTVMVAGGLAIAVLLRRSKPGSLLGPVARVVGVGLVFVALVFAVQAAEERFGVEGEGVRGAEQVIDATAEQTSKGGSEFEARRPDSITDVPFAVFTVLFRPLLFEAHNAQALLTSLEGMLLMLLIVLSWKRLRQVPRQMLRNPYVAFVATYSVGFMLAFASFGNFGILARQRSQLFPFLLVLLAIPAGRVINEVADRRSTRAAGRHDPVLVYLPAGPDPATDGQPVQAPTTAGQPPPPPPPDHVQGT